MSKTHNDSSLHSKNYIYYSDDHRFNFIEIGSVSVCNKRIITAHSWSVYFCGTHNTIRWRLHKFWPTHADAIPPDTLAVPLAPVIFSSDGLLIRSGLLIPPCCTSCLRSLTRRET